MTILSRNLKIYREKAGLNQSDLATALNMSSKAVSSWETGRTEPNVDILKQITKILNCTVNELLGLDCNEEQYELPFTSAAQARRYIQSIPMISVIGDFDIVSMSDTETVEFANDLIQLIKIAAKHI